MKTSIVIFTVVFLYRLLKNVFCLIRTNFYIKELQGSQITPLEIEPAITKIIFQTRANNYGVTLNGLREARAILKLRILENFSIFYWIETIFFLPSKLFDYLGINTCRKKHNFWEYFLSALGWCICFAIGLFDSEIKSFLLSLFERF